MFGQNNYALPTVDAEVTRFSFYHAVLLRCSFLPPVRRNANPARSRKIPARGLRPTIAPSPMKSPFVCALSAPRPTRPHRRRYDNQTEPRKKDIKMCRQPTCDRIPLPNHHRPFHRCFNFDPRFVAQIASFLCSFLQSRLVNSFSFFSLFSRTHPPLIQSQPCLSLPVILIRRRPEMTFPSRVGSSPFLQTQSMRRMNCFSD